MMREFTTRPAEPPQQSAFKVDRAEFTYVLRQDADSVLEWSEIADAAAASEAGLDTAEGAAMIGRYFQLFMDPMVYKKFRAHLRGKDPAILAEIMTGLNAEMQELVGKSTGRPTGPPSRSSAGRTGKGDRTLQIISLPEGEVEWSDPPPESRQQRRAKERKRTG